MIFSNTTNLDLHDLIMYLVEFFFFTNGLYTYTDERGGTVHTRRVDLHVHGGRLMGRVIAPGDHPQAITPIPLYTILPSSSPSSLPTTT